MTNYTARWRDDHMDVELKLNGHRHIERFTWKEWLDYVEKLDKNPFRIGGVFVHLEDKDGFDKIFERAAKAYLRQVNLVFLLTGQTDMIIL
jgi:hypothetical protein